MSEPVDALVVGTGAVGSGYDGSRSSDDAPLSHAGAYAAHPQTRLAAGVDPDHSAREAFTARWNVHAYATLREALGVHQPVLASVCTPASSRAETVAALLDAGVRGVWAEKPLAMTSSAADELVRACDAAGAGLLVNFLRRLDPLHRRVADRLRELGGARHVDVRYSGSLASYATHGIDLVRWWAGEPTAVTAVALDGREPLVALEVANGATALLAQVQLPPTELFEVDVFARGERLTLMGLGELLTSATSGPSDVFRDVEVLARTAPEDRTGLGGAMMCGVSALLDNVRTRAPLPCTGADAIAVLRVHEAIAASLEKGVRVRIGAAS
jgi:predicted dehydrogenase